MDEIFLPITNEIFQNILPVYHISNYGHIKSDISRKQSLGAMNNRYNRVKCSLLNKNQKCLCGIDVAVLEYCVFNNIPYHSSYRIEFKDGNPLNLYLENLYEHQYQINFLTPRSSFQNINFTMADYNTDRYRPLYKILDEYWIEITNVELNDVLSGFYISSRGNLYDANRNLLITPSISDNGYISYIYRFTSSSNLLNISAHRIEMKCFCPIDDWDNFEVDHINNNSLDNRLENLRWVTPEYNEKLRFLENQTRVILTDQQVIAICEAFKSGMSPLEISFYVLHTPYTGNVHSKLMSIYRKKTYKHITQNYDFK